MKQEPKNFKKEMQWTVILIGIFIFLFDVLISETYFIAFSGLLLAGLGTFWKVLDERSTKDDNN